MAETTTRVDFYVLRSAEPGARLRFACRLAEKAYALEHQVYVHTASAAEAAELDELLWTFRAGSFVPHELCASGRTSEAPVNIGCAGGAATSGELLVNLTAEIPAFFDQFARVAEIIDATEACKRGGRERFRVYRNSGYEPQTHQIS